MTYKIKEFYPVVLSGCHDKFLCYLLSLNKWVNQIRPHCITIFCCNFCSIISMICLYLIQEKRSVLQYIIYSSVNHIPVMIICSPFVMLIFSKNELNTHGHRFCWKLNLSLWTLLIRFSCPAKHAQLKPLMVLAFILLFIYFKGTHISISFNLTAM